MALQESLFLRKKRGNRRSLEKKGYLCVSLYLTMKVKLFLTFDHELSLGGLRTFYRNTLFEPTQRVLDTVDRLGVKVTLFTDILCACRYREWDYAQFYAPYVQQLQYRLTCKTLCLGIEL
jgi:hypothetical protein